MCRDFYAFYASLKSDKNTEKKTQPTKQNEKNKAK